LKGGRYSYLLVVLRTLVKGSSDFLGILLTQLFVRYRLALFRQVRYRALIVTVGTDHIPKAARDESRVSVSTSALIARMESKTMHTQQPR